MNILGLGTLAWHYRGSHLRIYFQKENTMPICLCCFHHA
uniref:Uncharacterized protein n=1 Tax=Rhizophora mucronata TaxID=61149 RepID=A0A2P2QNM4_RHIMU